MYSFLTNTLNYLEYVIRPLKVFFASRTADSIMHLQQPQFVTRLRPFLGLNSVFRRFIPKCARKAAPLKRKLQKDHPNEFDALNKEMVTTIKTFQVELIFPSIPALAYAEGHYTLDTGACSTQVARVLLQKLPDSTERLIGC